MPRNPFDSLPTLATPPQISPNPTRRTIASWARQIERCCCQTLAYFPLTFVYGLSTWAVWVAVHVSYQGKFGVEKSTLGGNVKAIAVVALYGLANLSYTIAVFTNPGSPLDKRRDWSVPVKRNGKRRNSGSGGAGAYQGLPTHEPDGWENDALPPMTMVTAKSSGAARYCSKCQTTKPDRTHHCSSCGRCVLKMDHHCPWLATCVGLHNYKAFFLFLFYISLFSWLCFLISASWVWNEIMDDNTDLEQGWHVVNTIMLAVLGGIIGLVISGFTAWHGYLVVNGQTTIESLEKTRYLSPLKNTLQTSVTQDHERHYLNNIHPPTTPSLEPQPLTDQIKQIHANSAPGILRPEEGEVPQTPDQTSSPANLHSSPAHASLQHSYAALERQREHDRYNAYLDELASERLPHAFNLGWRGNLVAVFGRVPYLWALPVCNSIGDGWAWEVSDDWLEARERVGREREEEERRRREELRNGGGVWDGTQGGGPTGRPMPNFRWTPGQGFVNRAPQPSYFQPPPRTSSRNTDVVQLQSLTAQSGSDSIRPTQGSQHHASSSVDSYSSTSTSSTNSSDRDTRHMYAHAHAEINGIGSTNLENWNDVPDEMRKTKSKPNPGRRKGD
ncbi:Hypothetical protein R9X50_00211700 [Acrodontium crateriforme]|uniref:Palmitoyltransferase n=1 Tax=Acrodontium crateriforme TaxID=150365 RepID=A0AAQ3M0J8_9PEZI|nr:Hypothetical protein R9X50_00211700 [Acrodontium crateriforme]